MPKAAKKSAGRRKPNGRKSIKGQVAKAKQKYEAESTPKEQISELDKEILTIKISESESKLNRKRHLCSFIEEEISIYGTLYEEKRLLKSESMKLLNRAFEDFATEIFLLGQELEAMRHNHALIAERKTFCSAYREKVQRLHVLEDELEGNLFESDKCCEEIPRLSEKLSDLQERAQAEAEQFRAEKERIVKEFISCLLRIQNELNFHIGKAIEDSSLKLDLLPVPYKALFLSGWLTNSWVQSARDYCELLERRLYEAEREYNDLLVTSMENCKKVKEFFSDDELLLLFQLKEDLAKEGGKEKLSSPKKKPSRVFKYPKQNKELIYLEIKCLQQENKIRTMRSEIEDLETAIHSLEVSGEFCFERSYLVQIICKAGNILQQEI